MKITIDDDPRVLLNGQPIFEEADEFAGEVGPILFRARPGDTLHVVATNAKLTCIALSPLRLHRTDTGQIQELNPTGVPQSCDSRPPGIFLR